MRISEYFAYVPLVESKDYGSAGIDAQGVNLGKLHSLSAFFSFGAITGNTTLIVYNGATAGAKTTAIAFKYRLTAAAYKVALADQFGDAIAVASTGLVLTAATFNHKTIVVEIDADTVTDKQPFVTFSFDNVATVLLLAGVGVGVPRYPGHLIPTVLT